MTVTVGQAGLGHWGKNLVRNFDELADLTWICDADEARRAEFGARSIAEDAASTFRIQIEQAQIEITKHVRDGERYLNARMYEQAVREFLPANLIVDGPSGCTPLPTTCRERVFARERMSRTSPLTQRHPAALGRLC